MVKRRFLAALLFTVLNAAPLSAIDQTLELGATVGWGDIAALDGVVSETGRAGNQDLVLRDAGYAPAALTDALIHFDGTALSDATGNYDVQSSNVGFTERPRVIGPGAGVFQGQAEGLILTPLAGNALFAPGAAWGDFTIEFWLYPTVAADGDTILVWQNLRRSPAGILPQELRCSFDNGRLSWTFENFFAPADLGPSSVRLEGADRLESRVWHHHLLRFSAETGLLEYRIDGRPESVTYATASGSEGGGVFPPLLGTLRVSQLVVGSGFTGLLDELRISRSFVTDAAVERFGQEAGSATSRILDLTYPDTKLGPVIATTTTPGHTDIFFYYKCSNLKTSDTDLDGQWVQFELGKPLPGKAMGRYLQLKFELLPDGQEAQSPALSSVTVTYTPHLPPPPPELLVATPGDGAVTLRWHRVVDADLAGYRVYYGDRPGNYFGTDSATGTSPIDVDKDTTTLSLEGLTDGKLYYIAVLAYNVSIPTELSAFSNEVAVRPSKLYGATK